MRRPRRSFWQRVRSRRALVAVAATVVIVGGYALWSVMSWQQYQTQYETTLVKAKTDIDTVLVLSQETADEKNQKITSLSEVVAKQADLDCRVNSMFEWQKIFGNQAKVDVCFDKADKLLALKKSLQNMAAYLKDEQALHDKMVGATPKQVDEEKFEKQVSDWQRIQKVVSSLEVSEAFRPVKAKAQEAASTIHDAWQRLVDAHKAEDQPAYEEARTKLPESYDRLAAIAPAADSHLVDLAKTLQTTYSTLFNEE